MEGNMSLASSEVAKNIIKRLIDEKLISPSDSASLLPKLATGKIKPEDWRLTVEKAIDAEDHDAK